MQTLKVKKIAEKAHKPVEKKKYYFHCTRENLGDIVVLNPLPTSEKTPNRPKHEGKFPRICVSDSISGCFLSIIGTRATWGKNLFVYKTKKPVLAFYPSKRVEDAPWTGEKWIKEDTEFKIIGEINVKLFKELIFEEKMKTIRKWESYIVSNANATQKVWKTHKKRIFTPYNKEQEKIID